MQIFTYGKDRRGDNPPPLREWIGRVRESMQNLRMSDEFLKRNVNEGFSGGEKKRAEILQLELWSPGLHFG